jgi:UDP-GlcNAc:undecaprenyl-phosphate GlcNAc-1-phosphate transferase
MPYLTALFAGAVSISFMSVPVAIRWALVYGVVQTPDWRRVHKGRIPCAGGLVFLPCLALGLAAVYLFWPNLWHDRYLGLLGAGAFITFWGLWDDVRGLKPVHKLGLQLIAGIVLYLSGFRLGAVSIPFTAGMPHELPVLDFVFTVVAVAAIINAVNMLDGLDGLAAGSVVIMAGFLFFNKVTQGQADATAPLVIVGGATLAFLRYNMHPARIFMGDTGSMFLGLFLAAEVFDSASQGVAVTTVMLPLVILGIPLLDMLRTVATRLWISHNVFAADKSHLHHRLLSVGLTHREAVLFIYGMNVYMGVMAVIYRHVSPPPYRGLFLFALVLFLLLASFLIGAGHKKNGTAPGKTGTSGDSGERGA